MKHLFWLDLEMTGLDENIHQILEAAVVVTDLDLNTKDEYHAIVYQPPEALQLMDDWCTRTHGESGLTALIPTGKPVQEVEKDLIKLAGKYFGTHERVVLVGNSISNDKRFIEKGMPQFGQKLHYRVIDVSSFKEIFRERYGIKYEKKNGHRALTDIHESIAELRHYLSFVDPKLKSEKKNAP